MKKYLKPEFENLEIAPLYAIAAEGGLSTWLDNQELQKEANISTFEFGS